MKDYDKCIEICDQAIDLSKGGNYDYVKSVHYQLLQEVISHPNLGITLSPVAEWTS